MDRATAEKVREGRCPRCGGKLHSANYRRKLRGIPEWLSKEFCLRYSLCCAEDGCRGRATPESVRFLGRRIYLAAVVILSVAMIHGLTDSRAEKLESYGISRRTLALWQQWWSDLPRTETAFWKIVKGKFVPAVTSDEELEEKLPVSLLNRFREGTFEDRLIKLLSLLGPLTGGPGLGQNHAI